VGIRRSCWFSERNESVSSSGLAGEENGSISFAPYPFKFVLRQAFICDTVQRQTQTDRYALHHARCRNPSLCPAKGIVMDHCAVYRSFTPYSARDDNPVKNIGETNRLSREKLCFYGGCTLVVRMHIKIRKSGI
jgi:hypothetical protein